jgi:hypothetical protein
MRALAGRAVDAGEAHTSMDDVRASASDWRPGLLSASVGAAHLPLVTRYDLHDDLDALRPPSNVPPSELRHAGRAEQAGADLASERAVAAAADHLAAAEHQLALPHAHAEPRLGELGPRPTQAWKQTAVAPAAARAPAHAHEPKASASPVGRRDPAPLSPSAGSERRSLDSTQLRRSLESIQLLSTLRSQLKELDSVHTQLQLHLQRDDDTSSGAAPADGGERSPPTAPAAADLSRGSAARADAQGSPARDPDEQPPSENPSPSDAGKSDAKPDLWAGVSQRLESPARMLQISQILRGGRPSLWDDDDDEI